MEHIFIAKTMQELLLTIKAKLKVALLQVQLLKKHPNFGQKSHHMLVQYSDVCKDYLNFKLFY